MNNCHFKACVIGYVLGIKQYIESNRFERAELVDTFRDYSPSKYRLRFRELVSKFQTLEKSLLFVFVTDQQAK